jgi:hypothetical protein
LRSPAIPLTSFHDLPLISSSFVLRHILFGVPLLLYVPEDSNLILFSILLLLLYVMCVQYNSIFFFLFDFLLASVAWYTMIQNAFKEIVLDPNVVILQSQLQYDTVTGTQWRML